MDGVGGATAISNGAHAIHRVLKCDSDAIFPSFDVVSRVMLFLR